MSLESINIKLKNAVLELIEVECDNYAQHLIKMMKIDKVVTSLMSFMLNTVYNDFDSIKIEEFDEIYTSLKTIKDGILLTIKNYFKECGSSTKKYEVRKLYNLIVSKLEVLVNEANTFKRLASLPTGKTQISKSKTRTLNYLKSKGKTKLVRVLNSNSVTNSINR